MRRTLRIASALCLTLAFGWALTAGCGDSTTTGGEICDNKKDDDNDGLADCADSDCKSHATCQSGDGGIPGIGGSMVDSTGPFPDSSPPDANVQKALQDNVMNTVTLPTSASEYAADLDGTGKKNQMGAIIGALAGAGFSLQPELDTGLSSGQLVILMEIFAKALDNDPAMKLQAHQGFDVDNDPKNNFLGSNVFGISSNSPKTAILNGTITSGSLVAGPGNLIIPLPLGGPTPVLLTLKKAQVTATVSTSGMTNGVMAGAIPQSEIDNQLIPGVAKLADDALTSPNIPQGTKDLIKLLLDTDKDGKISATDLTNNLLLKALLQADIDTDGDQKNDALSVGVAFTTVGCVIQK